MDKDNKDNNVTRMETRREDKKSKKQREAAEKYMNGVVRRKDLQPLFNELQKTQYKLATAELMINTLHRFIKNNKIGTDEQLNEAYEFEGKRPAILEEVVETKGKYEDRLQKCMDYDIAVQITNIIPQMKEDKKLKKATLDYLVEKFDLDMSEPDELNN